MTVTPLSFCWIAVTFDVVLDKVANLLCECLADHVHAANRLEHRRLEFVEREIRRLRQSWDLKMSDKASGVPGVGAAPSPPPGSLA